MNVFTAQEIQAAGIEVPRDFVAMVPNMTLVETQNVGNSFITIRGISQARNSEPSVAVLVDGVLETNPYEFDQELYDIRQIEVLKGPQGALYGRDAIGGAIIINTADPSDHFEGTARSGVGNGLSEKAQLAVSGPIDSAGTLRYRASLQLLQYRRLSGEHLSRPQGRPVPGLLRAAAAAVEARRRVQRGPARSCTTGPIPRRTTSSFRAATRRIRSATSPRRRMPTTSPVADPEQQPGHGQPRHPGYRAQARLQPGIRNLHLDHGLQPHQGNRHRRCLRFPAGHDLHRYKRSLFAGMPAALGGPFDESQSQFIDVKTWSQELRFTSPEGRRLLVDRGRVLRAHRALHLHRQSGRPGSWRPARSTRRRWSIRRIRSRPTPTRRSSPTRRTTMPGRCSAMRPTSSTRSGNSTWRYATTRTSARTPPTRRPQFLPTTTAFTGEVRDATFSAPQPKATLRYKPNDDWTIYGGWSRGFRSGGFNQTGVGEVARANGVLGVNDMFQAEIADTYEVGFKSAVSRPAPDPEMGMSSTPNRPTATSSSTSPRTRPRTSATWTRPTKARNSRSPPSRPTGSDLYAGFGYTDSKITAMADPTVIGNQAPLVSKDTINAGAQYQQPLGDGLTGTVRLDYQRNRTHLVGAVQHHLARSGQSWWTLRLGLQARAVDGHRLVEESHQHDLQCRVLAGQCRRIGIPVAGPAAALRPRPRLPFLIGRNAGTMREFDEKNMTQAVIARLAASEDPRFKRVMTSLITHLHDFVREVKLTEPEWLTAIQFLTDVGQTCTDEAPGVHSVIGHAGRVGARDHTQSSRR